MSPKTKTPDAVDEVGVLNARSPRGVDGRKRMVMALIDRIGIGSVAPSAENVIWEGMLIFALFTGVLEM
jgi:hypothetical protein